ncbi:MAG TPA: hypothetical protein VFX61_03840 [Micromonosporaceae bacterium]|nr:hypothetical protein [Micromonosporaceae bacterium]
MATVRVLMRGGPVDGEIRTLDVADADNPPETQTIVVHGPHERTESFDYRRVGRKPDGGADGGRWIYESSE